jgi:deoxyribodipyrimidine photolyase-related protein
MEFALDSYDWVMVGNVYSMALWADGGLTMRKPYISGSGYIMKMGNFDSKSKETKEWQNKWDDVFHHFIDRNGEKLLKTYYAGLVKAWGKQPQHTKNDILKNAGDIIKSLTTK